MRELVDISLIEDCKDVLLWFLMNGFPEGLDEDSDKAITEIIEEHFDIDRNVIDEFTGYYDGVFDDNDGYVDAPKSVRIRLIDGQILFIDFHPGAIEYYMDTKKIGELGPEYDIRKISYEQYSELTCDCSLTESFIILPMIYITQDDVDDVISFVSEFMEKYEFEDSISNRIIDCIVSNCLDE